LSSAVKLFLHQTALQKKLPFQVLTVNGYTPEFETEIKKDIEETMADLKAGKLKLYTSVEKLHRDILK
jgi:antitoxin component of RelBE/YafQ-DinJ toxin-antitoxin module